MGGMTIAYEKAPPAPPKQKVRNDPPWRRFVPRPDTPGDWESVDDNVIIDFCESFCDPKAKENLYRWYRLYQMALNRWAFRDRFWIGAPYNWYEVGNGFQFVELYRKSQASYPRPVDNMIRPAVTNEVARHTADEYEPIVVGGKDEPGVDAAAKAATEYLKAGLRDDDWPEVRETQARSMILEGTGIARSVIMASALTPVVRAQADSAKCSDPECGIRLASRTIPVDYIQSFDVQHTETIQPGAESGTAQLTHCPLCDVPTPLQDYTPSLEEVQGGLDAFQRDLGALVPKKLPVIENISNFDAFPENGGRFVTPRTNKIFGQATIRSLDWCAEFLPDIADDLEPESGWELLRYQPEFGSDHFGVWGQSAQTLTHHVMVYEVTVQPMRDLEEGATFIVAGKKVGLKDDLNKTVKWGEAELKVPRVGLSVARMASQDNEFWGLTPVDSGRLLNCQLNELDAQIVDIQERGYPRVFVRPGVELREKNQAGGTFTVVEVSSGEEDKVDVRQDLYISQPITGDAYMERRDRLVEAIKAKIGPKPIEEGYNEKNVRTVRGMQIISSQAAKSRGPSQRSLEHAWNDLFGHRLHAVWALTQTGDLAEEYETRTASGRRRLQEFKDQQMLGPNAVVEVEKATATDESVFETEAANSWVGSGFINPQAATPTQKRTIAKMMGVPESLGEEENTQMDRAEDSWREFIANGTIPVIDESLENAALRYAVLSNRWIGNDGMALQREIGWVKILRAIAPWREQLQSMEQREQALTPYRMLPPEQWEGARAKVVAIAAEQAALAGMPPPQQPPPAPPPDAVLPPPLPPLPQDRIYMAARELAAPVLDATAPEVADPNAPAPAQKADQALKFWAVIQSYKELSKKQQVEAMSGMGGAPAPSGGPAAGASASGGV